MDWVPTGLGWGLRICISKFPTLLPQPHTLVTVAPGEDPDWCFTLCRIREVAVLWEGPRGMARRWPGGSIMRSPIVFPAGPLPWVQPQPDLQASREEGTQALCPPTLFSPQPCAPPGRVRAVGEATLTFAQLRRLMLPQPQVPLCLSLWCQVHSSAPHPIMRVRPNWGLDVGDEWKKPQHILQPALNWSTGARPAPARGGVGGGCPCMASLFPGPWALGFGN